MGVTKGGILLPRPFGYDWELFNQAMNPTGRPETFLTGASGRTPKIVTRIPQNANIDDFDTIYLLVRPRWALAANFTVSVKNLRTSLVVATAPVTTWAFYVWTVVSATLAKTNAILPGDFLEVTLTWTSGANFDFRTYQKDIYFASGTQVGQAFPYADDGVADRFQTPAAFLTWQDADANVITEWMPGLLPMEDRKSVVSSLRTFFGNEFAMPFTDRRPSGFWEYTSQPSGFRNTTIRIYSEPASVSDFPELYSIAIERPDVVGWKMFYHPFDGDQPILEQGKKYIVGVDATAAGGVLFQHQWFAAPEPVHLGLDNLVRFVDVTSGQWVFYTEPPWSRDIHGEFGLVFEESAT